MLQLLVRIVFLTLPLIIMLAIGSLFLGTQMPPVRTVADLTFDFCELPCWAGITIDQTLYSDAAAILQEQMSGYETIITPFQAGLSFMIMMQEQNFTGAVEIDSSAPSTIARITLESHQPLIPLMQRFGTPDCVEIVDNFGQIIITLSWQPTERENYIAFISPVDNQHWNGYSQAYALTIGIYDACNHPNARPWIGFAPVWRYEQIALLGD